MSHYTKIYNLKINLKEKKKDASWHGLSDFSCFHRLIESFSPREILFKIK
jgi:hypothetical protein